MNNIQILNLEWTSHKSRDREVVSLVTNYLRLQGFSVYEGSIFDAYRLIDKLNPIVLYMSNSVGAQLNIDVIRYAKSKGIKCITGVAEGNFEESGIIQFLWGANKKRIMYEDESYFWNKKSYELALKYFPSLEDRIGVCGSVGFDRYSIVKNESSRRLKYQASEYKKVVGVACWNFDFTFKGSDCYKKMNGQEISDFDLEYFINDRKLFNQELIRLIKSLQDYLFVIKLHPGCLLGDEAAGVNGCRGLNNVIVGTNDFSVMEAIEVSDVWLTYESTTAVEAWLMGKPSALMNPSGTDFSFREGFHLGQPNFSSAKEWVRSLKELENTGELPGFNSLNNERKEVVTSIIEWDDGFNHVRMGNAIIELYYKQPSNTYKIKLSFIEQFNRKKRMFFWKNKKIFKIFPIIKKRWIKLFSWDESLVDDLSKSRYKQQEKFYKEKGLSKNHLLEIKAYSRIPKKMKES